MERPASVEVRGPCRPGGWPKGQVLLDLLADVGWVGALRAGGEWFSRRGARHILDQEWAIAAVLLTPEVLAELLARGARAEKTVSTRGRVGARRVRGLSSKKRDSYGRNYSTGQYVLQGRPRSIPLGRRGAEDLHRARQAGRTIDEPAVPLLEDASFGGGNFRLGEGRLARLNDRCRSGPRRRDLGGEAVRVPHAGRFMGSPAFGLPAQPRNGPGLFLPLPVCPAPQHR